MNSLLINRSKCVAIICTLILIFFSQQLFSQSTNQTPIKHKLVWFRTKDKSNLVFCHCEKYQKRADKEFELLAKSKVENKRKKIKLKMKSHKLKAVKEKRLKSFDSKSVRCFKW